MTADDVRRLALALPGAVEGAHHDHPDFRVGGRIFATLHPDGVRAVIRLERDEAEALVRDAPAIYGLSGASARRAWLGVRLGAADPAAVADLLERALLLRRADR